MQINELNKRLEKARDLLLTETIDAVDYRLIKTETEKKLKRLEAKLVSSPTDFSNIDTILDKALNTFSRLDYLYIQSDIIRKREIISSIFPEKLTFDGLIIELLDLIKLFS